MSDDFTVEPRWKERVLYREGDRVFDFDGGWGVAPPALYVPPAQEWDAMTPPWMHGRRAEIVARLAEETGHTIVEGPYPLQR
ncbi:hypothetical protein [Microbacterium sp.]|uniref:hypothetical protein n=1 Tax=Microbacterium sp. TaxID=51671 RepID=UPI003F700746